MGEAKRKKMSGEMDYWYHGTEEHFLAWALPPITPKYKPELHPHPFISLSKDMELAKGASKIGGLCRAKLVDSAKVLDLRQKSVATEEHWRLLLKKDLASHHLLVQRFDTWISACSTGEVLRLHTTNQELGGRLGRLQEIANNHSVPIRERAHAHLEVQNFTRRWIDDVINRARRHVKEMLLDPSIQSLRLASRVTQALANKNNRDSLLPQFPVSLDQVRTVLRLSVTLEDFATLQTTLHHAKKASWIPSEHPIAPCILLADLEVVFDILESTPHKIHYLKRRADLEAHLNYKGGATGA